VVSALILLVERKKTVAYTNHD